MQCTLFALSLYPDGRFSRKLPINTINHAQTFFGNKNITNNLNYVGFQSARKWSGKSDFNFADVASRYDVRRYLIDRVVYGLR